jgi:hypothetical protein
MIPFWDDSPEAWHTVALDGAVLPGVARIDSIARSRKVHAAQPSGVRGGRVRDRGAKLVKFKIVVRVWTAEQFERMRFLLPLFDYRTEPVPPARTRAARTPPALPLSDEDRTNLTNLSAADRQAVEQEVAAGAEGAASDEDLSRNLVRRRDQLQRIGLRPGEGVDEGEVLPATTAASRTVAANASTQSATTRSTRTPTKRQRRAVSIAHPATDTVGINRVFVESVEFAPPKDGKDVGEFTLECREYVPQPVSPGSSVTRTPVSIADAQIAPALRPGATGAGTPS